MEQDKPKSTIRKAFQAILHDNTSGSTEILNNTIHTLRDLVDDDNPPDNFLLKDLLQEVKQKHGNFAVLYHFLKAVFALLDSDPDAEKIPAFLKKYEMQWSGSNRQAAEQLLLHLKNKNIRSVLFHSNSSAIHAFCKVLSENQQYPVLFQTYSGSAGEGKSQVSQNVMNDFEIRFFHETAASRFIPEIDFAVFGADLIADRFFINKTGTYSLALLCREFNKPVYVLADSRKRISKSSIPKDDFERLIHEEPKDPNELWSDPPQNVSVVNYYFERIPLALVRGMYSEEGLLTPK